MNIWICGNSEELASLGKSNTMQRGEIVTTWEDAHVDKFVKGELVSWHIHGYVQLFLLHQDTSSIIVHLEQNLEGEISS